jgi:hypothetical protein
MLADGKEIDEVSANSFAQPSKAAYRAPTAQRYFDLEEGDPHSVTAETSVSTNEVNDGGVFERWRKDPEYRPAKLTA